MNELTIEEQRLYANLRRKKLEIENEKRYEENKPYVGKYFSYRNSYSLPKDPEDYWTVFYRVDSINDGGHLIAMSFQTDKNGIVTFEPKHDVFPSLLNFEITKEEFEAEFQLMKERIEL